MFFGDSVHIVLFISKRILSRSKGTLFQTVLSYFGTFLFNKMNEKTKKIILNYFLLIEGLYSVLFQILFR